MKNTFNPLEEKEFLNSLTRDYKDVTPYSEAKKEVIHQLIQSYFSDSKSKTGLQLGCSNGYETNILAKELKTLDVIDGSSVFIDKLTKSNSENKNVQFIYSLFEEYSLDQGKEKYDYVFCNYVLEHVYDVQPVLQTITRVIKPEGVFFAVVPNANAFSRQLAQQMNLLTDLHALTENDNRHGHRRVYDRNSFIADITAAGFDIINCSGIIFKILADFQLNDLMKKGILTREHINGLYKMGINRPEFSDSLFVAAKIN